MSGESTEIIESLSTDGPIGTWAAVGIGVVLALVFAWLLWSQRRATGPFWAGTFWLMRVVALALVLWMLLGPNWVTQRRTTKPQSVAILVDTSDSMDVSDPPDGPRQMRWVRSALGAPSDDDPLVHCDRAAVAIRAASHRARLAREAVTRHQGSKKIRNEFESVGDAVGRAVNHLEAALALMSDETTAKTKRIVTLLQSNIAKPLRDSIEELGSASDPSAGELTESMLAVEDSLGGVERRLSELTRNLERNAIDHDVVHSSGVGASLSRREHVARTLVAVQKKLVAERSTALMSIRPVRFDGQSALASLDDGWENILQTAGADSATTPPVTSGQDSAMTNISAALNQLGRTASAESIRSAILITDGAHNDSNALAPQEVAATLGDIPVHVIPIGHSQVLRDLILHRVDAPTAVVENDSILIDIIVTALQCAGESSTLILRKDGKSIDEQTLTFDKDRTDRRTFFQVPAEELGRHEFELSLKPLDDESSTTNNVAQLTVNVVQDTLRVLLADRIARWEYRYLEQLFRRDESITFSKLLFNPEVIATGAIAETQALPRDVDGWDHYDVVILGDLETKHFDDQSQQALDEFVRTRGGQLLVIGGQENMPGKFDQQALMELLPVEKTRKLTSAEGLQVMLTPSGLAHPALTIAETAPQSERVWKEQFEFLPLYSLSAYSRPRPTARSLIAVASSTRAIAVEAGQDRSPDHVFLCWHQVGAGRVVYLTSPATYRLRFRRGDRYHHRFWGQMLRWLTAAERGAGTQTVRINTDRQGYEMGDAIDVTARLLDQKGNPVKSATVGATATPNEGPSVSIDMIADEKVPGRYIGSFSGLPPGVWRITPTGLAVEQLLPQAEEKTQTEALVKIAEVGSLEQLNTRCNVTLLRQIAEVTGGQMVPPTAIDEILTLSALAQEVSERVERQPLWNRWSLLIIAFGCLSTEWVVRKRLGLV